MQTSPASSIAECVRPSHEDMSRLVRSALRAFSSDDRPDFDQLAEVVNSIACLPWVGGMLQMRLANRLGASYDVSWPLGADEQANRWSVEILRQSAAFAHAEVLVARIEDPSSDSMKMVVETVSGSACFTIPVYRSEGMVPWVSYEECELTDMPATWARIIGMACEPAGGSRRHAEVGLMMAKDWFNDGVKRYGDSGRTLLPPTSA